MSPVQIQFANTYKSALHNFTGIELRTSSLLHPSEKQEIGRARESLQARIDSLLAEKERLQAANAELQRQRDNVEDEKEDLLKDLHRKERELERGWDFILNGLERGWTFMQIKRQVSCINTTLNVLVVVAGRHILIPFGLHTTSSGMSHTPCLSRRALKMLYPVHYSLCFVRMRTTASVSPRLLYVCNPRLNLVKAMIKTKLPNCVRLSECMKAA